MPVRIQIREKKISVSIEDESAGRCYLATQGRRAVIAVPPLPCANNGGNDTSSGVNAANPGITRIGEIDVSIFVDCDADGAIQHGADSRAVISGKPILADARDDSHHLRLGIDSLHATPEVLGEEDVSGAIESERNGIYPSL